MNTFTYLERHLEIKWWQVWKNRVAQNSFLDPCIYFTGYLQEAFNFIHERC